jgi:hypothetical protein
VDDAFRQELFQIVQDPRFPGVEEFKALLGPTAEFKKQLVERKLVNNLNKLYGWHLSESGNWDTAQANDVMFEIVATPGFQIEKALRAISSHQKP